MLGVEGRHWFSCVKIMLSDTFQATGDNCIFRQNVPVYVLSYSSKLRPWTSRFYATTHDNYIVWCCSLLQSFDLILFSAFTSSFEHICLHTVSWVYLFEIFCALPGLGWLHLVVSIFGWHDMFNESDKHTSSPLYDVVLEAERYPCMCCQRSEHCTVLVWCSEVMYWSLWWAGSKRGKPGGGTSVRWTCQHA